MRYFERNLIDMPIPPKDEIATNVKGYVSAFSGTVMVLDTHILKDPPLTMDSTSLAYLAIALRQYIKSIKNNQTIAVTEVRADKLSVLALIDLVYTRITT